MRKLRLSLALFLVALLLTLSACAKKSEQPVVTTVTLEQVRKEAATAFDGTISSAQRRSAADEAMRLLLALLSQPDSTAIADADWAKPPRPGVEVMVRHFALDGGVHLYALSLPGNTLVETRERLAVQVRRTGSDPEAFELAVLPDSKVQAVRALREGSKQMLTLALSLNSGGGYVAHFESGSGGQFVPAASAFSGLGGTYGGATLAPKDGFLMVSLTPVTEWKPSFDERQPLRLMLAPDLTLDWKQRFVVVDDSKFDAFALFKIALNPYGCKGKEDCPEALLEKSKQSPKEAAKSAWEQATARMTTLLQNEKTWSDDFAGKLPEGARSLREQGRELSVRLLTVPAPEGITPRAYTAVQFRAGGGIPMARTVNLPGLVESYRVISHEGLPALFLVVDQTKDPKSSIRTKGLHLLRLNAGNDWVPATGWIGSIPNAPHWNLTNSTPDGVQVEWESSKLSQMSVSLESGAEPAVAICKFPSNCHKLTWVGGKLHSLAILFAQLTEATQALPEDQLLWRASQLAQFLVSIDPAEVSANQLTSLLDPNRVLKIKILDAGGGTRIVTMPANPSGMRTAVVHTKGQALVARAHDGVVAEWESARVVQGGKEQRLLILGRSDKGFALLVYQWDGDKWVAVDPLSEKVDRILQISSRAFYTPGQTRPVRGLVVFGGASQLTAKLTTNGAEFCENRVACLTYGYNNGWKLETR
ncbi:MAG: hypothetical protein ACOY94_16715 [Bacillota bacterium]